MYLNNKLSHFYHIYSDGNWEQIVSQHFDYLQKSNLITCIDNLSIGLVGNNKNCSNVKKYLNNLNIDYKIVDQNKKGWEQLTLNKLYEYSLNNDSYILYCHTKGSSKCSNIECKNLVDPIHHSIARDAISSGYFNSCFDANSHWTKKMSNALILDWENCVNKLNDGYDSIGCFLNYRRNGQIFYWGNFWWSKSSLIQKLGQPSINDRYDAEKWLFKGFMSNGHKYLNLDSKNIFE